MLHSGTQIHLGFQSNLKALERKKDRSVKCDKVVNMFRNLLFISASEVLPTNVVLLESQVVDFIVTDPIMLTVLNTNMKSDFVLYQHANTYTKMKTKTQLLLEVPRSGCTRLGDKTFSVAAPSL